MTEGVGKTVASDDIGGVQFQRVKLNLGADGVDDGGISAANPLPVSFSASGTQAVYLSGTAGTIAVDVGKVAGTVTVRFDPGYTLGSLQGISNSINTYIGATAGTLQVKLDRESVLSGIQSTVGIYLNATSGTIRVKLDPESVLSGIQSSINVRILQTAGTLIIKTDPESVISGIQSSIAVYAKTISGGTDPASEGPVKVGGRYNSTRPTFNDGQRGDNQLGTRGSLNVTVYAPDTVSTGGWKADNADDVAVSSTVDKMAVVNRNTVFDGTTWDRMAGNSSGLFVNTASTVSIFTVSGSTSGVSPSGVTLVSPSANASFKVFAFSLQTTGLVSLVARFTNGGGSATEFWRGLVTANETTGTPKGANLAVPPPSYLFATGVSTTLALHLDTASLVHYSVSFIKESA